VFLFIRTLSLATQKARVMLIVLLVAGSLWLLLAGVMVFSVASVSRQASPEVPYFPEPPEEEFCGDILSRDFLDDTVDQQALLSIEAETGSSGSRDLLLTSNNRTQWQSSWRSPLI
jgi:hypothetical protein